MTPAVDQQEAPKHTRPFSTIYLRLFIPFSVALLLGTVIAWWIGTSVIYRTLEERVLQQLNQAVQVVAEPTFPVTATVLTRLNELLGASLYVFGEEATLQVHGGPELDAKFREMLNVHYRAWQARNTIQESIYFTEATRNYLLVLRRANGRLQTDYRAVAALTDLSDVRAATRRGGFWLAGLAVFGISLLAFIGHWIARSITTPVADLALMAGKIAAGDRTIQVEIPRQDEIGELAESLNRMTGRLIMYEQQVAEQSRLLTLGELSAKLAHEIRNPLTAIKMQLQLLEDELQQDSRPRLESILDEVRRLELIVATTLQLGRPGELLRKHVDLNALVLEVVKLVDPHFRHRGIVTTTTLANDLPKCPLDADQVKQVMLNLMNNAAEELPGGGSIGITTKLAERGGLVLEVSDSGPGIPLEMRQSLFNQTTSSKPSGFGLGLRVTRELVELHNGSIEVADSEMGGALFRVVFPLES